MTEDLVNVRNVDQGYMSSQLARKDFLLLFVQGPTKEWLDYSKKQCDSPQRISTCSSIDIFFQCIFPQWYLMYFFGIPGNIIFTVSAYEAINYFQVLSHPFTAVAGLSSVSLVAIYSHGHFSFFLFDFFIFSSPTFTYSSGTKAAIFTHKQRESLGWKLTKSYEIDIVSTDQYFYRGKTLDFK